MRCTNCNEAVCMYCNVGSNDTATQRLIGPKQLVTDLGMCKYASIYKYTVRKDMQYSGGREFSLDNTCMTFCSHCKAKRKYSK